MSFLALPANVRQAKTGLPRTNALAYLSEALVSEKKCFMKLSPGHHLMETQQRGRACLQCLRPLLQAARDQPAPGHAEGGHPDPETEAQERVRLADREKGGDQASGRR